MATDHILSLLISERDRLNKAIEALGGATAHASRPTKSVEAAAPVRGRRTFSAAQKKQQSERMKAYWAARRKKAKA